MHVLGRFYQLVANSTKSPAKSQEKDRFNATIMPFEVKCRGSAYHRAATSCNGQAYGYSGSHQTRVAQNKGRDVPMRLWSNPLAQPISFIGSFWRHNTNRQQTPQGTWRRGEPAQKKEASLPATPSFATSPGELHAACMGMLQACARAERLGGVHRLEVDAAGRKRLVRNGEDSTLDLVKE